MRKPMNESRRMRKSLGRRFEGERRDILKRDKGFRAREDIKGEMVTNMNDGPRITGRQAEELAEDFMREHHD
jgi:hypothetical protein